MSAESTIRTLTALSIFPLHATRFILNPYPLREAQYLLLLVFQIGVVYHFKSDGPDPSFLCGFVTTLMTLRLLATLIWEVPADLRDRRNKDPEGYELKTKGVGERLRWGLSWITTLRGINWNWKVKNVPAQPAYSSRWNYLVRNLPMVVLYGCVLDIIWKARVLFDFTKYHGSLDGYGSSASRGVGMMVVNSLFGLLSMWVTTVFNYEMMAVVAVGIGLSRPEDWPPVLGPIEEGYSLRRFWSKTWHQLFRNIFEKYGAGLIQLFRLDPTSSEAHNYTRLLAFFISGLIHTIPISGMPFARGIPKDKNTPFKGSDQIVFFMIHAILCFVEEKFVGFYWGRRGGETPVRKWERAVGYLWVSLCLVCTTRYLFDEMELSGLNDKEEVVPWSVVNLLEKLMGRKLFGQD